MKCVRIPVLLLGLLLVAWRTDGGREIRVLTGTRTRVVWCQDTEESGSDIFAQGSRLRLMGLDTGDRRGERAIVPEVLNYTKPLITPTGSRVVFSNRQKQKVYVVNWDGNGLKEIADGMGLEVWMDPQDHVEWVYVGTDPAEAKGDAFGTVRRYQISNPSVCELVWDKAPVNPDSFQLSADGTRAGACFPWPNCGVAILPNESWKQYAKGCWTAFSPDNSYILWIFDGSHRNIELFAAEGEKSWKINVNSAPGIDGYEVYHPRWSNHVRFMTMTGPYRLGGEGATRVRAGGPGVEIYIGRFDPTLTKIERWARVTNNKSGDFFPDVWIEGGENATAQIRTEIAPEKIREHRKPIQRLVVMASLADVIATPTVESIAPYRRALAAYTYEVEKVISGDCSDRKIMVAHWVILDGKALTPPQNQKGKSYQLRLERFEDHPELESERLIMDSDKLDLALYYNVGP